MTETYSIPINQTEEFKIMKQSYEDLIKLGEKIKKDFEKTFKHKADEYMDAWYDSYAPYRHKYRPKGSLKEVYKIEFDGDQIFLCMGEEYMKKHHHQRNEIIYNNSFVEGYHGGSWGTKNPEDLAGDSITEDDGPHFRTPASGEMKYMFWGNPAVKSAISPRDAVIDAFDETMIEMRNKYLKKYTMIIDNYNNAKKALGV